MSFRIGVIGTGHIGRLHSRILSEVAPGEFCCVYDQNTQAASEVARIHGVRAAQSLEDFVASVDAATVATPTPFHFAIGKRLLESGRHVLIEKPITETTADAQALVELASARGLALQVGHVERYNPILSALEERLHQPRFIESHRLSPYPKRSTEIGVVLDLMIHDLEIILHLVRSPLLSVDAVGVPVLSTSEDIANARLHFENGCIANLTASRVSPERLRKIRVFQEDCYLSLDYMRQEGFVYRMADEHQKESSLLAKLFASGDTSIVSEFAGRKILREPVPIEKGEPLKQELLDFVQCAKAGVQPKVSGSEGTAALALALEITRRIQEHGRVHPFVAKKL
ncbi:MAG: gfo/Idh/MocA family oxidoreductase [Verrucomicrobia bacterium]|nr:gfo/Idh/MocA family oxidoreductase [Verrucomicrobiota bacterium]